MTIVILVSTYCFAEYCNITRRKLNNTFPTGEGTYDNVPDQISGVFFGWVKSEAYGVSKAVVSIGWDLSLQNIERVMVSLFSL
jgi:hypothetical protein